MERSQKVKEKAGEMISRGQKPSVPGIASELDFTEEDVHRCLNLLEAKGEVETYTINILGQKHRMIGVKR